MEKNDIRECLSKIIQLRFYWLSCHGVRAVFLGLLDGEVISDFKEFLKDKKYVFSKEDSEPGYPYGLFLQIYQPKGDDTPREKWLTFLRRAIILTAQAEIEELTNIKNIPIESLILDEEEHKAFIFLRKARVILFHTATEKKLTGSPVEWHGIKLDNSGDILKMKDGEIDLLIRTIIIALVKNIPDDKLGSLDLGMALDIDEIKKINDKRKRVEKIVENL